MDNAAQAEHMNMNEIEYRYREMSLRERVVAAKEREISIKDVELKRSRWFNPTVIGIFAAAAGLFGNVLVAAINNSNTQAIEHAHAQSNLIVEAIKTGSPETACKNLLFFVKLGLLVDSNTTIQKQCTTAPAQGPSLPISSPVPASTTESPVVASFARGQPSFANSIHLKGKVIDAMTNRGIPHGGPGLKS